MSIEEPLAPVVKRVIHTTADFEYAETTVRFRTEPWRRPEHAIRRRAPALSRTPGWPWPASTDVLLAQASAGKCTILWRIADVAEDGRRRTGPPGRRPVWTGRLQLQQPLIFAIGNAPTALIRLYELIREGKIRPEADHRRAGGICQCGCLPKELIHGRRMCPALSPGEGKAAAMWRRPSATAVLYQLEESRGAQPGK